MEIAIAKKVKSKLLSKFAIRNNVIQYRYEKISAVLPRWS